MKRFLIMILALSLMTVSAYATDTRTLTMGDNGTILVDDANMSEFYGRTFNYPNIAVGEFTAPDAFNKFGMNLKFGDDKPWVLGLYFSTDDPVDVQDFWGTDLVDWQTGMDGDSIDTDGDGNNDAVMYELPQNRRWQLFYGRELMGNNFGFHFEYNRSSSSFDNTNKSESSFSLLKFGVGLTSAKGDWDVATDMSLGSLTDKNAGGKPVTESDTYNDFSIRARYFYELNPTYTFVPHVEFGFGEHSVGYPLLPLTTDSAGTTAVKSSHTSIEFGLGLNATPTSNVLAVLDFGFMLETRKNETTWFDTILVAPLDEGVAEVKETEIFLPFWKIGFEADVFKWLDVRMGATSDWKNHKIEDGQKMSLAETTTYLGLAFHFGRLHIDAAANPRVFLNGFDFVSGNGGGGMHTQISALYEMF